MKEHHSSFFGIYRFCDGPSALRHQVEGSPRVSVHGLRARVCRAIPVARKVALGERAEDDVQQAQERKMSSGGGSIVHSSGVDGADGADDATDYDRTIGKRIARLRSR